MTETEINLFYFNGRGSSGKDTQADLVAGRLGGVKISTGDILRGAQTPDGEHGEFHYLVEPHLIDMHVGKLFPDDKIVELAKEVAQAKLALGIRTIIFTGFPRTMPQLKAMDQYAFHLKATGLCPRVEHVCFAVLPSHSESRAAYRREQARLEGTPIRLDDRPETVARRLAEYRKKTELMLRFLLNQERLKIIKASGSIEEVFQRTLSALGIED